MAMADLWSTIGTTTLWIALLTPQAMTFATSPSSGLGLISFSLPIDCAVVDVEEAEHGGSLNFLLLLGLQTGNCND